MKNMTQKHSNTLMTLLALFAFLIPTTNAFAGAMCSSGGKEIPCADLPGYFWIVIGALIIVGIVLTVLWFVTLIRSIKRSQTGWIVSHFIFGPLTAVAYLLFGNSVTTAPINTTEPFAPQNISQANIVPKKSIKWGRILLGVIIIAGIYALALFAQKKLNEFRPVKSEQVQEAVNESSEKVEETKSVEKTEALSSLESRLIEIEKETEDISKELASFTSPERIAKMSDQSKEELDADAKRYSELYAQLNKLRIEETQIAGEIAKSSLASMPENAVDDVYKKFCVNVSVQNKEIDYSAGFTSKINKAGIGDLISGLTNGQYSSEQIPVALLYVGFKLVQTGDLDGTMKFYSCAAENYYEISSMYKMAQIYKYGSDAMAKEISVSTLKGKVEVSMEKVYYWLTAMIYTDIARKTGLLDPNTSMGWNAIAMLDDIQMTNKLSDSKMIEIETKVREFIGKRYPEVLNSDDRVFYHKI